MKLRNIILSLLLAFIGVTAQAQTFVVVDKNGNRTTYDVSKLDSVTFQQNPPAFTVYENTEDAADPADPTNPDEPQQEVTTYQFDEVQSLVGDPKFLFAHPDTVFLGADNAMFHFQLRTNVEYGFTTSDTWLTPDGIVSGTDSLRFLAAMNPMTSRREAKIFFASKDNAQKDTLVVIQYGKTDSRYIAIDWDKTTLVSYDAESGKAVLKFQDDVPVMGDYDVVLLPGTETYQIRVVDNVEQVDDKTVSLDTREGAMGNLFKDQQFTLCSDPDYDPTTSGGSSDSGSGTKPSQARAFSAGDGTAVDIQGPVYYPETIELMQDGRPVAVVYDRAQARAARRNTTLEHSYDIFEYHADNSGSVIWESGSHKVSWQECKFDVGLRGIFSFDFGDVQWEKVRFGDLKNFKAYLDGDFNTDLILQYALTKGVEAKAEKKLVKDIFSYRVKFMVGVVPVWINLSSDLMASVEAKAEATVTVSGGVRAQAQFQGGIEWAEGQGLKPISKFDYQYEVVTPNVKAEAHTEAKAYVWPKINIGIYDVLAPTINPKPYIRAYADARTAEANNKWFGWNAGVSAGIDLTATLDLKLWKWEKTLAEIGPINLADRDLVAVPTKVELEGDTLVRVLNGTTREVKYTVKGHNYLTGADYPVPGALLKVESLGGGKIDKESGYYYTGLDGTAKVLFEQSDTIPGYLKVTLYTGDEERDAKCRNWHSEVVDFRFKAVAEDNQISATRSGKAEPEFLLEEWTKKKEDENGEWRGAYGYKVGAEVTGGTVEKDTVITDGYGYAIFNFDGGTGFSGGTLKASAKVEEFDTLFTQKITINKFSFDDPHLAKAYNLPNNTASFDGTKLPVKHKHANLTVWKPDFPGNTSEDINTYRNQDYGEVIWGAMDDYHESAVTNVYWTRNWKMINGYHKQKQLEIIHDINSQELWNQSTWEHIGDYTEKILDEYGRPTGYEKNGCFYWDDIDPDFGQRVFGSLACLYWTTDSVAYKKYRDEQIEIELQSMIEEASEPMSQETVEWWREWLEDNFAPEHQPLPAFEEWKCSVETHYARQGGSSNTDFYNGAASIRYFKDDQSGDTLRDPSQGKQVFFEEGNNYVFLVYRLMPNGDAVHVKLVFDKNDPDTNIRTRYYINE